MTIKLPEKLQCLFTPSRYKTLYGGRGGAKSQSIARALLLQGAQAKHKILCAREIQKSIQDSVHSLLKEQIEEMGLESFYEIQKSTILGRNGTEFLFAGLRSNIANIKSIPNITRAWIEEAQSASATNIKTLALTVRAPESEIWLSFNPELEDDPVYQEYVVTPPDDSIVVKVNYSDNPFYYAGRWRAIRRRTTSNIFMFGKGIVRSQSMVLFSLRRYAGHLRSKGLRRFLSLLAFRSTPSGT